MNVIQKVTESQIYFKETYGLSLRRKQLSVLESKEEFVEETFERNEGCTTTACIKALEFAINHQDSKVLLIAPFRPTAQIEFNYISDFLKRERLCRFYYRSKKNGQAMFEFELINGSRISIKVSNKMDSLRGVRSDCTIIEPSRVFDKELIDYINIFNTHSKIRQTVVLNQVDSLGGQPLNI